MSMSASTTTSIGEDAGIENFRWVEHALRCSERAPEERGPLPAIPGHVIAPDGVVVGDRSTRREEGVGGAALDVAPLFDEFAGRAADVERVIGRWAVGINMCEPGRDDARAAGRLRERRLGRGSHGGVKRLELVPGDGTLESVV